MKCNLGAGGGSCTANGSGNINDTVNLPVGASVTYTLGGTLSPSATGSLSNTASVAAPGGVTEPVPGNNSATDTDVIVCGADALAVPDGRATASVVPANESLTLGASVRIGNSYSVAFRNITGITPPGTLAIFSGDDACGGPSTVTVSETSGIDPVGIGGLARVSFRAGGSGNFFRAKLVNGTGSSIPISFSWSDTTMFSPAWSDNGSFDTFYSFLNSTGTPLHGTLTLLDPAGAVVTTLNVGIPVGQTATTNTAALGIARNRTGTARFTHDGPPGAIIVEAAIANFSISPAYVQPVKFQTVREAH